MSNAILFGLRLPVTGGSVQAPTVTSPLTKVSWNQALLAGTHLSLDVSLELFGTYGVHVLCQVDGATNADGDWIPVTDSPGSAGLFRLWQIAGGPEPAGDIVFDTPGFRLSTAWADGWINSDTGGTWDVRLKGGLVDDNPISVAARGTAALILDVANTAAYLHFKQGAFAAQTSVGWLASDSSDNFTAFNQIHMSQPFRYELTVAGSEKTFEIRFTPNNGANGKPLPLPLHGDIFNQYNTTEPPSSASPIVAAMSVEAHALAMAFRVKAGGHILSGLALTGCTPDTPFTLTTHALGTPGNISGQFTVPTRVPLHLRVRDEAFTSSLFIGRGTDVTVNHTLSVVHGHVDQTEYHVDGGGETALRCLPDHVVPTNSFSPDYDAALHCKATFPHVAFTGPAKRIMINKPGYAYVASGAQQVERLGFEGSSLLLPLSRRAAIDYWIRQPDPSGAAAKHLDALDAAAKALTYLIPADMQHETQMHEVANTRSVEPASIFSPPAKALQPRTLAPAQAAQSVSTRDLRLNPHSKTFTYGNVSVTVTLPGDAAIDYILLRKNDVGTSISFISPTTNDAGIQLSADGIELSAPYTVDADFFGKFGAADNPIIGVIKLSQQIGLSKIIADYRDDFGKLSVRTIVNPDVDTPVGDVIDSTVLDKLWVGVMLFGVKVHSTIADNDAVGAIVNSLDHFYLCYLAVSATADPNKPNYTGHIYYTTKSPDTPTVAATVSQETTFLLVSMEMSWYNSDLNIFNARARLTVGSFFGRLKNTIDEIKIIGTYDRPTHKMHLVGSLPKPVNIVPASWTEIPIEQFLLSALELTSVDDHVSISINGTIVLRKSFSLGGVHLFESIDPNIDFNGLRIPLSPFNPNIIGRFTFDYPSLNLKFTGPSLTLGLFNLSLRSLIVDFDHAFDWSSVSPFDIGGGGGHNGDPGPSFIYNLRLELMKLPELSLKSVDRFILDLFAGHSLALPVDWGSPRLGIAAFEFRNLHLDLMRFLAIDADSVGLIDGADQDNNPVKWFEFTNASLSILGVPVVKQLSFFLYAAKGDVGFIGVSDGNQFSFIGIDWVVVGHNVLIDNAIAEQLIAIETSVTPGAAFLDGIRKHKVTSTNHANAGRWLFAAGFNFGGLIDGKFLFADGAHYGIELSGGLFEDLLGYDFAITVLYNKGSTPDQDSFYIAVRVPFVNMGPVSFQGGVIALEIVMNGGFTVDLSFPPMTSAGRDWSAGLGAIFTPFSGYGGAYFQRHHGNNGGTTWSGLSFGWAAAFGLGASGGATGGVFRCWVTADVFAVLEGSAEWAALPGGDTNLTYLQVIGAVGLIVRGGAELDFWIISVRIEISLGAEASATITWGTSQQSIPPPASLPAPHTKVKLDMMVWAHAEAKACIGGGWFKICASISVTLPLEYSFEFQLN